MADLPGQLGQRALAELEQLLRDLQHLVPDIDEVDVVLNEDGRTDLLNDLVDLLATDVVLLVDDVEVVLQVVDVDLALLVELVEYLQFVPLVAQRTQEPRVLQQTLQRRLLHEQVQHVHEQPFVLETRHVEVYAQVGQELHQRVLGVQTLTLEVVDRNAVIHL